MINNAVVSAMFYAGMIFDEQNSTEDTLRFKLANGCCLKFSGWNEIIYWTEKYIESPGFFNILYEKDSCEIWQMDPIKKEPKGMPFLGYDLMLKSGFDIYPDDYVLVYSGNVSNQLMPEVVNKSDEDILDRLFHIFNCEHPVNYRGRSMSVSDIVVLSRNGIKKAYYVDNIGFRDVTDKFTNIEVNC